MIRTILLYFLILSILISLFSIGFGYVFHWLLPIGLDTSIIIGFLLTFMLIFIMIQTGGNDKNQSEIDNDDIKISARDFRYFTQPTVRKPRRK
jgi:hypothetical protein